MKYLLKSREVSSNVILAVFVALTFSACKKESKSHLLTDSDLKALKTQYAAFSGTGPKANHRACFVGRKNLIVRQLPGDPDPSTNHNESRGVVGVGMNGKGQIVAYYAENGSELQEKIDSASDREEMIDIVAASTKAQYKNTSKFFRTSGSPLDFHIENGSVTAIRVFPEAWAFDTDDSGFKINNVLSGKPDDLFSPFTVDSGFTTETKPQVVLVDFNRGTPENRVPRTDCVYKYELPIISHGPAPTNRETKIIIDPGVGNNGGPPTGP